LSGVGVAFPDGLVTTWAKALPVTWRRKDSGKGTFAPEPAYRRVSNPEVPIMDGIIYLVGLIVIIMAILSFFGLR
jgi:hypothetical protein